MSDLWDVLTGKSQREGDAADAKLAKLNRDKFDKGEWSKDTYDLAEQHRAQGVIQDTQGSVITEAKLGAAEGLANVAGAINTTIDSVASNATGFVWKAIPWWAWLLLALGGLAWLWVNFAPVRTIFKRVIPK